MMRYLPDTNVWIRHLNPDPSPVKARIRSCQLHEITLCDVVKAELYYGAYRSTRRVDNLTTLSRLFAGLNSLSFDGVAAKVYGALRADLEQKGTPIGPYDLQIASIAMANLPYWLVTTRATENGSRMNPRKPKTGSDPAQPLRPLLPFSAFREQRAEIRSQISVSGFLPKTTVPGNSAAI